MPTEMKDKMEEAEKQYLNRLAREKSVGVLDIIEDTHNLFRDVNTFCNKPEVVDFVTETATTVLEVALAIILFKLVVRVLFK